MKSLLLSVFLAGSALVDAQTKNESLIAMVDPIAADARVVGKVLDGDQRVPLVYATITVKSLDEPGVVTGGLSSDGGKFLVDALKPGKYEVNISFIGYQTITKIITIDQKQKTVDLGEIVISADSKSLAGVEVTAKKQDMTIGIDRKVFDVEKNAITTGGTALDVLRQVPTLQVDIDGNISLRGSDNITIFMNGKNTGISGANLAQVLKSMPASSVKSVELITNPSAKYDAAGTSGIINIITKKNVEPGNFGSATVSVGNNNKYNANATYNTTSGKLSTSTTIGVNSNQFKHSAFSLRDNFNPEQASFSTNNYRNGKVTNDGVGMNGSVDYTFNPKNALSLSYWGGLGRGFLKEENRYEFLDANRNAYNRYNRFTDNHFTSPSADLNLTYTKTFDAERKNELVLSSNYSVSHFDDDQNYLQRQQNLGGEDAGLLPYDQHIDEMSRVNNYTFQADYTKAVGETMKLEAGAKSNIRRMNDSFEADSLNNATGIRERNNVLSNTFSYNEMVNAAYVNYSGSLGKWGYQGGVRAEHTGIEIYQQAVSAAPIRRNYANFFPSLFVNRKWEHDWETQLSYSRRINRPNSEFLNPFPDYTDPLNIRRGNPYLNPEFVNAYEASAMKYWTGHSLTVTGYYRDIRSVFQRIRQVNNEGVSVVEISNFGKAANMGAEIIARTTIKSWWTNTVNLNLFRTVLNGQTAVRDYATDAFNWNVRLMSSFRFMKNADLQVSAVYMAPYRIPQGYYYGYSGVDLGFKKEVFAGRGTFGVNVQDVFNTRKFKVISSDYNYSSRTEFKRESQWISANFTWKFGKPGEGQQPRRARRSGGSQGSEINVGM
ncbi:MAG: TonB-dependent receptor family protein [Bacteroidota bacterium]